MKRPDEPHEAGYADDEPETRYVGAIVSPLATTEAPPAPETVPGIGPRPGQTRPVPPPAQTLPSGPATGIQPEALARWIGERLHSDVIGRHLRDLSDVRTVLVGALVERFGLPEATIQSAVDASTHQLAGDVHVDAKSLARRLNDLGAGT